jgi:hypothetical protein
MVDEGLGPLRKMFSRYGWFSLCRPAKAFMHNKPIQAILPRPLKAFVHYIVCEPIATYHLDQMIATSEKRESGIGFLAQERLVEESDKWCDKAANPEANLLCLQDATRKGEDGT